MAISKDLFLAILAMDSYNRGYGAGIRLLGRVPKAELRGCSDVISKTLGA